MADDKNAAAEISEETKESFSLEPLTWTDQEERRLRTEVDCLVMPMLMFAFFTLQLDRGNIANALTNNFMLDVGITQDQFNLGLQLFSVGLMIWEIPSQIILYKTGPTIWLGGQIVCWGLVATFQAFQQSLSTYLVTRFLLGTFEAGFVPAAFYTITRWYKKDELSKRFAIFFLGNLIVLALGNDIAYGILQMKDVCGLRGWQWLFIIEGMITIVAGIVFILLFPSEPSYPVCLCKIRYFNERETQILIQRASSDDPTKSANADHITKDDFKRTFSNWRLIPHIVFTFCGQSPYSSLIPYGPLLVESWGYGALRSNAMVSIGFWCQVFVAICLGFVADQTKMRGPVVLFGAFFWWLFLLISRILVFDRNTHTRFGILTAAYAFSVVWHPINASWMALNARTSGERAITMAILVMAATAAGIPGSQFFQARDAPNYEHGFTIILAMVSVALLAMCMANLQYFVLNRRAKHDGSKIHYQQ